MKDGVVLARESIKVIRDNPYLLIFWTIPLIATITSNIFLAPHITIRVGIICLTTFFTACFMHELLRATEHKGRNISHSIRACAVRAHLIIGWGLISAGFYELINTESADNSWFVFILRVALFLAWPLVTFYLLPIIAIERMPIMQVIHLTAHLLKNTVGKVVGGSLYFALILIVVGIVNALTLLLLYWGYNTCASICALLIVLMIYLLNIAYAAFRAVTFFEEYKKPLSEIDILQFPQA